MSRELVECPWPYNELITFTECSQGRHKYASTDMYIVKDNKLYNLVEEVTSEDLYVPLNKEQLLVYQEELDGSTINKEQAKTIFPEEFI